MADRPAHRRNGTAVTGELTYGFPTVTGRGLIEASPEFVHQPFLVVTMEDLWPWIRPSVAGARHEVHLVRTTKQTALDRLVADLPTLDAVVGIGGGQALDVAKYVAWRRRLPLFQFPTALTANAVYGHRSGVRTPGKVVYRGWAVPECVFVDLDVIAQAPRQLNYSGIGDVLCLHTGVLDWRYAWERGRCEAHWPFDADLADQSLARVQAVVEHATDLRDLTPTGLAVLLDGLQWGTSFHGAGWNPRHIEGVDHFLLYVLEHQTGRTFIHGQPVGLGVYVGSRLHDSRAEEMLRTIRTVGLDIRPAAMGLTWDDVAAALGALRAYVREAGLWHSIAHDAEITPAFVASVREAVEEAYRGFES